MSGAKNMTDEKESDGKSAPDKAPKRGLMLGIPSFRGDAYRSIYANICQVSISNSDFRILCALAGEVLGEMKFEELATIYLSPVQAKSMATVLSTQVKEYEKRFGQIPSTKLLIEAPAQEKGAVSEGSKQ